MSRYRYFEIECDFEGCGAVVLERLKRDAIREARSQGWEIGKHDYCAEHRKPPTPQKPVLFE
jgi:hypothetical protein